MESLRTEVFHPVDWDLRADPPSGSNPFFVQLYAIVRGPGHQQMTLPGFYKGGVRWCIRFAPPSEGTWRLLTISSVPDLSGKEVAIESSPNSNKAVHGPLRVDDKNPAHFRYADGTPCFVLGYEIDWLWALDQTSGKIARVEHLLDMISGAGFNHVLVNAYAHDTNWCQGKSRENDFGPPELFVWEGSPEKPNYERLNPAYFDHYDRMMRALLFRGIDAHIYLKVYNKMVPWPARYSAGEDLFFDYFVARYQAFPNVIWDFSKECYNEPDKDYVAYRLKRIRELDAYAHLTTVHDDWYFSYNPPYNELIDFLTDQNHSEFYQTIIDQRSRGLGPVLNAEYGYEHGPGGMDDYTYGVVQSPLEVLTRTYEVVMAGGYPAYYYTNHAWDVVEWKEVPAGLEGYRQLKEFFTSTSWHKMSPRPDLGQSGLRCLTDGQDETILFSRRGRGSLVAPPGWDGTCWTGFWMDIATGKRAELRLDDLRAGKRHYLNSPFEGQPSVAYLRRS